jgi:hypothetical protein
VNVLRWTRYARGIGLVMLAAVTIFGVHEFATGDMTSALDYWRDRIWLFPIVLLLACLDLVLESIGWIWICARFGIRASDAGGICICLASRAGLLMPAQLGRVIRPDSLARLRRASLEQALKVEGVTLALDTTSVMALMAGLFAAQLHPLVGIAVGLGVVALALAVGQRVGHGLSDTRMELPAGFWWRWQTLGIIGVEMAGWAVHGVALWVLIRGLPGEVTLPASIFFDSASAVLGVGTGLPGGVGAIEGLLGASLSWMRVPAEHLAFAIGGFRLATFWLWVPIGWLALVVLRRWTPREEAGPVSAIEAEPSRAAAGRG